jgi:hypothetical protein
MSFIGSQAVADTGNIIRTAPWVACTAASGGTVLGSGAVRHGIKISNIQTVISGAVFVGGLNENAPFSGQGYYLLESQSLDLAVGNLNQVRICAVVSGVRISYIGIDR